MMMTLRSFLSRQQQQQQQRLPRSPTSSPSSTPPKQKPSLFPSKRKDDRSRTAIISSSTKHSSNATVTSGPSDIMARYRESGSLSPPSRSPPNATITNVVARPETTTSAVQIPVKKKLEARYKSRQYIAEPPRRLSGASSRRKEKHNPDSLPPSVASLLAITSIPPPRSRRGSLRQQQGQVKDARMTVDSIVPRSQVSEKELSQELSLTPMSRSPLDVLLTPPEDLLEQEEDASVTSGSAFTSALSTREASFDSLPSLGDSFGSSVLPSVDSPLTSRGRRSRPPMRSLEPVSSSPGEQPDHPLYVDPSSEIDQVEFKVFDPLPTAVEKEHSTVFMPLKTAFKSNLTASLRALRSAAKSLSTFTASSIPPEDLLTRSILTADPGVPFTDERRPPVLEEEPSEAMRRYLNPTSNARLDLRTGSPTGTRCYTASIQMRTYKVQKSRSVSPAANRTAAPQAPALPKAPTAVVIQPGPRQREIRENSNFIRIAVMEHMMRKKGKLADSREGHAHWLLPPRKPSSKAYEIGADGVPVRWVGISQDII